MPFYEYKCNICGNIIEKLHDRKNMLEISYCNKCNKYCKVTKLMSRTRTQLGWRPTVMPGKKSKVHVKNGQVYSEDNRYS